MGCGSPVDAIQGESVKKVFERVRNGIRTLFRIRRKRRMPPVGSRPAINTYICRGDLKMLVTHEIDEPMWQWLALQNWRKSTVSNDRRRYRYLPEKACRALVRAPREELETVYRDILAAGSQSRPPRPRA
jgi:hypothetical protein